MLFLSKYSIVLNLPINLFQSNFRQGLWVFYPKIPTTINTNIFRPILRILFFLRLSGVNNLTFFFKSNCFKSPWKHLSVNNLPELFGQNLERLHFYPINIYFCQNILQKSFRPKLSFTTLLVFYSKTPATILQLFRCIQSALIITFGTILVWTLLEKNVSHNYNYSRIIPQVISVISVRAICQQYQQLNNK